MKYFARISLQSVQNVQCQLGMQSLQEWTEAEKRLAPKIMALGTSAFSWCFVACENIE